MVNMPRKWNNQCSRRLHALTTQLNQLIRYSKIKRELQVRRFEEHPYKVNCGAHSSDQTTMNSDIVGVYLRGRPPSEVRHVNFKVKGGLTLRASPHMLQSADKR